MGSGKLFNHWLVPHVDDEGNLVGLSCKLNKNEKYFNRFLFYFNYYAGPLLDDQRQKLELNA